MKEIYLVRHGETEWNRLGKYQGWSNVPLNEMGKKQARACAKRLEETTFHTILASDLDRAYETAKMIASKQGAIKVNTTSALREINFGQWEALTYHEIEDKWPGDIHRMYSDPKGVKVEGGESFLEVQERAMKTVLKAVDEMPDGERLLVVCHGGTIRTLLCAFLEIDLNRAWNFRQGNTAINVLHYYGSDSVFNAIDLMNDTAHIKEV